MAFQQPEVPAGTEEYMRDHGVLRMFENAVRKLVMEQPQDPIPFLKRAFAYQDSALLLLLLSSSFFFSFRPVFPHRSRPFTCG